MLNNRKRVNYAIYENIGGANTGNWHETEYCVLCRKNGKMGLWGQINVDDGGDAYSIRIRYPRGYLYYGCGTFMNELKEEVGQLSFIRLKKEGECILIFESYRFLYGQAYIGPSQVLVQKLPGTEGFRLEFSYDDAHDDKEFPWYFRRFDDPLMAAMIYNEQANMSNKFKERYGVTLPRDISDELVAMLLCLPFLN